MKYELNYRHMSKKLNQVSNLQKFYDKLKAIGSFIEPDFNELDKIEGVFIPKKNNSIPTLKLLRKGYFLKS